MATNPCMDCAERHPGCHGNCSAYEAFRIMLDIDKGQRSAEKKLELYQWDGYFKRNRDYINGRCNRHNRGRDA